MSKFSKNITVGVLIFLGAMISFFVLYLTPILSHGRQPVPTQTEVLYQACLQQTQPNAGQECAYVLKAK